MRRRDEHEPRVVGGAAPAALALIIALAGCYESDANRAGAWDDPANGNGACGDGTCDPGAAESCSSCADDCGPCAECAPPSVAAAPGVDYATQIQPLFDGFCTGCHGPGGGDAGLGLADLQGILAVVEPCDCQGSLLHQKCGPNPPYGERMPKGGPYMSDADRALICQWIDEGAEATYDPATCGGDPGGGGPDETCGGGTCGDGACSTAESCADCEADCGACEEIPPPECVEPAAGEAVTYTGQIRGLLENNDCTDCHSAEDSDGPAADLDLGDYLGVLSMVRPCDCENSILYRKVSPEPPYGDRMPKGEDPLSSSDMALLCDWIAQGAPE